MAEKDKFILGGREFSSRLLLGTGKFPSAESMAASVKSSGASLVTASLKRYNPESPDDDLFKPISESGAVLVPNTSGARNAEEALYAAMMGREASGSDFVKLEIHPDPTHLMPDPVETLKAAEMLVKEKFIVLPYINADPVLARRLEECGCAAVMPLGSPIGSGMGLSTFNLISIIIKDASIPVIVDAGIRSPSDACAAMEAGADAVLVNTAIAVSKDPPTMAFAFASAVKAGRLAFISGIMKKQKNASASSPLTSFLGG
ncbi:MAG: thiazole synthase [Fibrobacterota bacterium]